MNQNKNNTEVIYLSDPSECLRHPFHHKQIVFTGALSTMTRSEAAKKVRACGGIVQGAVTKETDFVILGKQRRSISTKQLKAEQFIHLGLDIQMITEDDFIWLISI
ncbi:BRCT domain-containing protein [Lysinibacillus sp. KU-BSD001]|uniref:BRCT domain-containing protein n=1 Tax=Lysinibacillus sp. KU-BSD001 TaxID=3141328 RepID=UPI0036E0C4C6